MHHAFERRVGLWRAGYTKDGDLVCDTRYGDWPQRLPEGRAVHALSDEGLWQDPEWMLLSYKKKMTASSYKEGSDPQKAVDEDVRTWWQAEGNSRDEWLKLDLGKVMDVRAIQIRPDRDAVWQSVYEKIGQIVDLIRAERFDAAVIRYLMMVYELKRQA